MIEDGITRQQIAKLHNENIRLQNLINAVIRTAVETIASLHVRPEGQLTQGQEEQIHAEAAQLFVHNLKANGLYPDKKAPTDIIKPN